MSPPELPRAGTAPAAPTLTTTDDARAGQTFADGFDGTALDRTRWLPHYLPQWSSREASAATHHVAGSCLHLIIPPVQGLWCEGDHEPPLRVSGIQSGCWSGPVGSPRGQQPFRTGQRGAPGAASLPRVVGDRRLPPGDAGADGAERALDGVLVAGRLRGRAAAKR